MEIFVVEVFMQIFLLLVTKIWIFIAIRVGVGRRRAERIPDVLRGFCPDVFFAATHVFFFHAQGRRDSRATATSLVCAQD